MWICLYQPGQGGTTISPSPATAPGAIGPTMDGKMKCLGHPPRSTYHLTNLRGCILVVDKDSYSRYHKFSDYAVAVSVYQIA